MLLIDLAPETGLVAVSAIMFDLDQFADCQLGAIS